MYTYFHLLCLTKLIAILYSNTYKNIDQIKPITIWFNQKYGLDSSYDYIGILKNVLSVSSIEFSLSFDGALWTFTFKNTPAKIIQSSYVQPLFVYWK